MRKYIIGALIFLFYVQTGMAQVTFRVVSVPANTPPDAEIYIAGNFNTWQPGSPQGKLSKDSAGIYTIQINPNPGTLEFKFTRGAWSSVEANAQGGFRPNRTFSYAGADTTIQIQIEGWEDLGGSQGSTASPSVSILDEAFYIPQLNRNRRIWLYLPPDYETTAKHYPVLYMHDGQNLFDVRTSFSGEWKVDEHLDSLFLLGDYGCIVVGIDNGGTNRINEYSPWVNPQYGGGQGDAYLEFLIETLKPYVDEHYRTLPDAEHTGIMGSSMGGLISYYGGLTRQDVFGRIGAFSSSFWFSNQTFSLPANFTYQEGTKIYMIAGGMEGSGNAQVRDMERVRDSLLANTYPENQIVSLPDPNGAHNEAFWARSFTDAYQWLFGSVTSTEDQTTAQSVKIIPYYSSPSRTIYWNNEKNSNLNFQLLDASGRVLAGGESNERDGNFIIQDLGPGIYFFSLYSKESMATIKFILY